MSADQPYWAPARSCKDAKCAEPTLWPTPTPVNLAPARRGARKRYGVPKSSKGFWGTEALWGGGGAGLLFTGRGYIHCRGGVAAKSETEDLTVGPK